MSSRNTVRESSHISFFYGMDLFCEVVRRPENTHGEADRSAWVTSGSPPFAWAPNGFLPSVQNYRPYIVSQVPCRNMNILFASRLFCLWLVIGTYILLGVFPVICWSYLQTEISVILSTGNKLHFSFSCETTLLTLSCDCIESVKFIIAS